MRHLAPRVQDIAPFHVMELLGRAQTLEAQGRDIVHMEVGEPDFATPAPILAAAHEALQAGRVPYTGATGLPALREAIAGFYQSRYGISVSPRRIVVTAGASAALTLAMAALASPGRGWLLTDPGYPCNRHIIRAFEGVPKAIPVSGANRYQPTLAQLEAHWDDTVAGALLASPGNPTGTLLRAEELQQFAELARRRQGHLVVDEIYHGLTYGLDAPTALAAGEDVWVVQSFSKYFCMTGWRLGWLVVPEAHVDAVERLAQNLYIAPSTPAQWAALAAFEPATIAILEERRAAFQARRDLLLPGLAALGFTVAVEPEGAFYVFTDCSSLTGDSYRFAWDLLEQGGVAATPGIDFGEWHPERHLRFAYTTSLPRIELGLERLAGFLKKQPAP